MIPKRLETPIDNAGRPPQMSTKEGAHACSRAFTSRLFTLEICNRLSRRLVFASGLPTATGAVLIFFWKLRTVRFGSSVVVMDTQPTNRNFQEGDRDQNSKPFGGPFPPSEGPLGKKKIVPLVLRTKVKGSSRWSCIDLPKGREQFPGIVPTDPLGPSRLHTHRQRFTVRSPA